MARTQGVLVRVGKKPDQVTVPNVVGQSPDDATKKLTDAKLNVAPDIQEKETDDPNQVGKVTDQSPAANTQVNPGTQITLTVGKAPDLFSIQFLHGILRSPGAWMPPPGGKVSKEAQQSANGDEPRMLRLPLARSGPTVRAGCVRL